MSNAARATTATSLTITKSAPKGCEFITSPEAMAFVSALVEKFQPRRDELLKKRVARQKEFDGGALPDFLPATKSIRESEWKVAEVPADLLDRRVEITGPAEPKMVINALNSGAKVFMADLEDSLSPTWEKIIEGQKALYDAVREQLVYKSPEGKEYKLNDKDLAVLIVRPRGWHLPERHVTWNGAPICGALLDFGLYFFHNAKERLARKRGAALGRCIRILGRLYRHSTRQRESDSTYRSADCRLRDARDFTRAERLRGGSELWSLGLYFLDHQEAAWPSGIFAA